MRGKKRKKFMRKCKLGGSPGSVCLRASGESMRHRSCPAPEDEGLNSNEPKHAALTAMLPRLQEQTKMISVFQCVYVGMCLCVSACISG